MKTLKLGLLALVLILTGCDPIKNLSAATIQSAVDKCSINGGLEKYKVRVSKIDSAYCINGAVFEIKPVLDIRTAAALKDKP